MTKKSYRQALTDAREELRRLFHQREKLERRIAQTKQSVLALQHMVEETPSAKYLAEVAERRLGLTDAIRAVFRASTRPLNALDIRNKLEGVGYDVGASPNVLNNVHTVVRRLHEANEIKHIARKATSNTSKEKGYLFTDIAFWWGEYAVPKGWTLYPDKRLINRWKKQGIAPEESEGGAE